MLSEEQIEKASAFNKDAKDAFEASLVNSGNYSRIITAMRKAMRGEKVTLASIGGSVTEGADATPHENCYAERVFLWWKQTFPQAEFKTINAGIGATGSVFGSTRIQAHVLDFNPDFVTVDFSVNDIEEKYHAETYEGVIRHILNAPNAPACMLLLMTSRDFENVDFLQIPVGLHYNLPIISMKNGMRYMVEKYNMDISYYMGSSRLHPNNEGHKFMAELICNELEKIKALIDSNQEEYEVPQSLYNTRFASAKLLGPKDIIPIENDGWEINNNIFHQLKNGWTTTKKGAKISFEIECSAMLICFLERHDKRGGVAKVFVDGVEKVSIENYFSWCGRVQHRLIADGQKSKHLVEVIFTAEKFGDCSGEIFDLFGLIVGE